MHDVHDIKLVKMYVYFKCNVKRDTQNTTLNLKAFELDLWVTKIANATLVNYMQSS
jgi:hypothetical protein